MLFLVCFCCLLCRIQEIQTRVLAKMTRKRQRPPSLKAVHPSPCPHKLVCKGGSGWQYHRIEEDKIHTADNLCSYIMTVFLNDPLGICNHSFTHSFIHSLIHQPKSSCTTLECPRPPPFSLMEGERSVARKLW